jgi:hypothetical protein
MFGEGVGLVAATLRMDTLKFVRKLTGAGMEPGMAEAIVEGLAEADTSELATRSDLVATKTDLRADMAVLRTELAEMKAKIFRFMLLQAVAIVGLTVALIKLLP